MEIFGIPGIHRGKGLVVGRAQRCNDSSGIGSTSLVAGGYAARVVSTSSAWHSDLDDIGVNNCGIVS